VRNWSILDEEANESTGGLSRQMMSQNGRIKVSIRCRSCGEKFILRGKKDKGRVETGFKQCLCENTDEFDIDTLDEY
jgi:hypothetical protein